MNLLTTVEEHGAGLQVADVADSVAPPFNGGPVYEARYDLVHHYFRIEDDMAVAIALWSMVDWVLDAFDAVPYLGISSPEPEAGKSNMLALLAALVARPYPVLYDTPLSVADAIDSERVTVLYDEHDATFRGREKLRGIFNAGYKRDFPYRTWVNGKRMTFDVFSPKAFAGIGALPQTIASRCIVITMQRLLPDEQVPDFLLREVKTKTEPIRELTEVWAQSFLQRPRQRPEALRQFNGRTAEIVGPLLMIAESCGKDISAHAAEAFANLFRRSRAEKSDGVKALEMARELFSEQEPYVSLFERDKAPSQRIQSNVLAERLGITQTMLASRLEPYGILPKPKKYDGRCLRGYEYADFVDIWRRYLKDEAHES